MAEPWWVPLAVVHEPGRGNWFEPALPEEMRETTIGSRLSSSFDDSQVEGFVLVTWKRKDLVLTTEEEKRLRENDAIPQSEGPPDAVVAAKFRRRYKHTKIETEDFAEVRDVKKITVEAEISRG